MLAREMANKTLGELKFFDGLTTEIRKVLALCRITEESTVEQLVKLYESELLRTPNMGRVRLNVLKERLREFDLHLGMDVEPEPEPEMIPFEYQYPITNGPTREELTNAVIQALITKSYNSPKIVWRVADKQGFVDRGTFVTCLGENGHTTRRLAYHLIGKGSDGYEHTFKDPVELHFDVHYPAKAVAYISYSLETRSGTLSIKGEEPKKPEE